MQTANCSKKLRQQSKTIKEETQSQQWIQKIERTDNEEQNITEPLYCLKRMQTLINIMNNSSYIKHACTRIKYKRTSNKLDTCKAESKQVKTQRRSTNQFQHANLSSKSIRLINCIFLKAMVTIQAGSYEDAGHQRSYPKRRRSYACSPNSY